ncbi:SHOCT domain-containing protein [Actinomadura miaoliensis]|uniref:SHOCT domain-containing protein n=2 Tax=Actinomadura miaoliensis TaxID=430685 RepID=A0ABP7VYZ9_9ACTN
MMWGYGPGYWLGMGVIMVLFWGLIVAGIVALVRYIGGARHTGGPDATSRPPRAEEVLAERFARGEVDADEYRQRLELLRARR